MSAAELSDDQRALLAKRREAFPQLVSDSAIVAESLIRSVCAAEPQPFLDNFELFVPAIDELFGDRTISPEDAERVRLPLFYFVAELWIRTRGGTWVIDDLPDSRHFGQFMVDVPGSEPDSILRLSPYHLVQGYLTAPAPRSLRTALASILPRATPSAAN